MLAPELSEYWLACLYHFSYSSDLRHWFMTWHNLIPNLLIASVLQSWKSITIITFPLLLWKSRNLEINEYFGLSKAGLFAIWSGYYTVSVNSRSYVLVWILLFWQVWRHKSKQQSPTKPVCYFTRWNENYCKFQQAMSHFLEVQRVKSILFIGNSTRQASEGFFSN